LAANPGKRPIEGDALDVLAGDSPAMRSLRALIRRVATSDSTVLILGESGTGKELVAQSIHRLSTRHSNRFVPVNCGAIPADLLESELFGHTKGAFTGALADRRGRFELANSGTLFLDEIGDMRLDMQVKLLRVLQERVIDRVGDDRSIPVNVRVVAATHRQLEESISQGKFRADLFYRLNVVPLYVPALRDRGDDVTILFDHFAKRCATPGQLPIRASEDLREWMTSYSWPGNCRELLNLVERLTVFWPAQDLSLKSIPSSMLPRGASTVVGASSPDEQAAILELFQGDENLMSAKEAAHAAADCVSDVADLAVAELVVRESSSNWSAELPAAAAPTLSNATVDLKQMLADFESAWIREAMKVTEGNITHAAELLGLARTTLIERLRKYDLSASRQ
jgi:sigma-54 specific flagellar transcriptional regulator A